MSPEISVIIPLYNKESCIRRTLNSVLSQTFTNFEIIVVDDGSTDKSFEIVSEYKKDSRLRIIQQENSGPGAARNKGIDASKCKYLAFLDADDEWLAEYLEKSKNILEKYPECDVCANSYFMDYSCDLPGCGVVSMNEVLKKNNINIFGGVWELNKNIDDGSLIRILSPFRTSAIFAKKDAAKKYYFYEKNKHCYGEDAFLWLNFAMNHKIYINTEPIAFYHNQDSHLAEGGYSTSPLEAFLIEPESIISKCLEENKSILRRWLNIYALRSANNRLGVGRKEDASFLVNKFPEMRKLGMSYYILRLKLMFWFIYKFLKLPKLKGN